MVFNVVNIVPKHWNIKPFPSPFPWSGQKISKNWFNPPKSDWTDDWCQFFQCQKRLKTSESFDQSNKKEEVGRKEEEKDTMILHEKPLNELG